MITKKILFTGLPEVGKTSIIRRFVHGKFNPEYRHSQGIRIDSRILPVKNTVLDLRLCDAETGNSDPAHIDQQFHTYSGVIHVVDPGMPASYEGLAGQIKSFQKMFPYMPVFVAVNKSDLYTDNSFDLDISSDRIFYTSALSGDHLDSLFKSMGEELLKSYRQNKSSLNLF